MLLYSNSFYVEFLNFNVIQVAWTQVGDSNPNAKLGAWLATRVVMNGNPDYEVSRMGGIQALGKLHGRNG
jgi:hypothetical protein